MKSQICDLLGIEFPMVAFSHCRDVVAAVSKAGGMGVLVQLEALVHILSFGVLIQLVILIILIRYLD